MKVYVVVQVERGFDDEEMWRNGEAPGFVSSIHTDAMKAHKAYVEICEDACEEEKRMRGNPGDLNNAFYNHRHPAIIVEKEVEEE